MPLDGSFLGAITRFSGAGRRKLPFDMDSPDTKRNVVQINDLQYLSVPRKAPEVALTRRDGGGTPKCGDTYSEGEVELGLLHLGHCASL